ncbi:MAG: GNAT family N-acetyltransferase [Candidatus Izemoplasmatales bacterium]|jgi:GNAT superfamily N-acetyltransferase|nr:GNAT family N-acetyltransferase [Candidatus Izemoplasmatales bacterium]
MVIRQASIEEFKELWEYSGSTTYKYFLDNLESRNVEFWTIDNEGDLIGELYIFWNSDDKDEANGYNRAYLCAFRVDKGYQGKGYGSQLMKRVLKRVRNRGYTEVTIGIDNREYKKLKSMYNKFGFDKLLKSTKVDNHYKNFQGKSTIYDEDYQIYINYLEDTQVNHKEV